MGEFGGNAGLLSLWFDETDWEWKAEYESCPLGTQHFWWFVHFLDLGVVVAGVLYVLAGVFSAVGVDVDGMVLGVVPGILNGEKKKGEFKSVGYTSNGVVPAGKGDERKANYKEVG